MTRKSGATERKTCQNRQRRHAAPDFTSFWKQSLQQGFNPTIATVGKALLFPRSLEALDNIGRTAAAGAEASMVGKDDRRLAA